MTDRVSRRDLACFRYFPLFSNDYYKFTVLCWNDMLSTCGQRSSNRVVFVGLAFQSMSYQVTRFSCRVFFPTGFFFGMFFLVFVLTVFFVNCRSVLF